MRNLREKLQKLLKNEKGLTLVELLAVIVILGIIAAIAIPAIGGIIDNSRQDAHIANAEALVSASRLAAISENINDETTFYGVEFTGDTGVDLVESGYLEGTLTDPDDSGSPYDRAEVEYDPSDNSYIVTLQGDNEDNYITEMNIETIRSGDRDAAFGNGGN